MLRCARSGDWVGTFQGHKGAVWSAALGADAARAATGSADFTARVWDAVEGQQLAELPHPHIVKAVAWAPAQSTRTYELLATGCADRSLRVWDLRGSVDGKSSPVTVFPHPAGAGVRRVAWAPSASPHAVLTGAEDGAVRLWDLREPPMAGPARIFECGPTAVMDMEIAAGDGGAALIAAGRTVFQIDVGTLAQRARFDFKHDVECATLLPGGAHFVAGGADCHLHAIALDGGAEVSTDRGHHGTVHAVRAAPDGMSYASGADDATIRMWAVPAAATAAAAAAAAATAAAATAK